MEKLAALKNKAEVIKAAGVKFSFYLCIGFVDIAGVGINADAFVQGLT
jgi:hypothetical protein